MMKQLSHAGMLTVLMDINAGSSGKGKMGSWLVDKLKDTDQKFDFLCNTFHPQAGHWVRLEDGRQFFYQSLNSAAYNVDAYDKMYVAPGAMIELPALMREIEENKVPTSKLGISPLTPILENIDTEFEQGVAGFDGTPLFSKDGELGTARTGSTSHGVGSCLARRILRRKSLKTAKDIPALHPYLCNVSEEIMARLNNNQRGLLEVAQGFQLSLMHPVHAPFTTSRNVTVSQAMSDLFLPTRYAGHVVGNVRTYPIRINSNKFICASTGRHLTWAEVQAGVPHTVYQGNSGGWYKDQREVSWEELTQLSGSPDPIMEITSVTKLPRRVATFSNDSIKEFVKYNDTGHGVSVTLNFTNYIDYSMTGARTFEGITSKFGDWFLNNVEKPVRDLVIALGTGALTEDVIDVSEVEFF